MMDAGVLDIAMSMALYSQDSWEFLNDLFSEAEAASPTRRSSSPTTTTAAKADGTYADNSFEAFIAIYCVDYPVETDPAVLAAAGGATAAGVADHLPRESRRSATSRASTGRTKSSATRSRSTARARPTCSSSRRPATPRRRTSGASRWPSSSRARTSSPTTARDTPPTTRAECDAWMTRSTTTSSRAQCPTSDPDCQDRSAPLILAVRARIVA